MIDMVRYCPKCGKENSDEAEYCRECGEQLPQKIKYVKSRDTAWGAGRIIIVLIAGIILIASFGMIMGGYSLRMIQDTIMDTDGYIMSGMRQVSSNTYAIVFEGIDINIEEPNDPLGRRITESIGRNMGDLITLKITAKSNNDKPLFLGIAQYSNVAPYLGSVNYDRLISGSWEYDPWDPSFPDYIFSHHPGSAPSVPPTLHSYWVAHAVGADEATMTWGLEPGNFWIVVMNEDASMGVDIDLRMGAKVPLISAISNILLSVGLFTALAAAAMIYYGAIRR